MELSLLFKGGIKPRPSSLALNISTIVHHLYKSHIVILDIFVTEEVLSCSSLFAAEEANGTLSAFPMIVMAVSGLPRYLKRKEIKSRSVQIVKKKHSQWLQHCFICLNTHVKSVISYGDFSFIEIYFISKIRLMNKDRKFLNYFTRQSSIRIT